VIGKGKLYTKGDIKAAIRDFKITPIMQFSGPPASRHRPRKPRMKPCSSSPTPPKFLDLHRFLPH
jgi:hypothetical protein